MDLCFLLLFLKREPGVKGQREEASDQMISLAVKQSKAGARSASVAISVAIILVG